MHALMEERILEALRAVVDPDFGVNIVDLGLVYAVGVLPDGGIFVQLTLREPASPLNAPLVDEAEAAVRRAFPGNRAVYVQLVWNPPWSPSTMSENARRAVARQPIHRRRAGASIGCAAV